MKLEIEKLKNQAFEIRKNVLEMLAEAGSGHSAGSLGMTDIFTALYFSILKHDPAKPDWEERDRLVLSCGHICPALYAVLVQSSYFPIAELKTLRKINFKLQGHPHNLDTPGVEISSGPLGQGISQAIGMALAAKLDKKDFRVFCIESDGEQDEGQVWEANLFASKYKLNNLIVILDRNKIQLSGNTEKIMPLESLKNKYLSFGWEVLEMNGHNFYEILQTCAEARESLEKPVVILAHTLPGKGVNFMEGQYLWHGKAPNQEELKKALSELEINFEKNQ